MTTAAWHVCDSSKQCISIVCCVGCSTQGAREEWISCVHFLLYTTRSRYPIGVEVRRCGRSVLWAIEQISEDQDMFCVSFKVPRTDMEFVLRRIIPTVFRNRTPILPVSVSTLLPKLSRWNVFNMKYYSLEVLQVFPETLFDLMNIELDVQKSTLQIIHFLPYVTMIQLIFQEGSSANNFLMKIPTTGH